MNGFPIPPGFPQPEHAAMDTNRGPKKPVKEREHKTFQEECSEIFKDTLTPRHATDPKVIQFILKYVECRHAGQAAQAVGLSVIEGKNLYKYKDIYECIRLITEKSAVKFGFGPEEIVERMKEISDFDPINIFNPDGTYKDVLDWPPGYTRVIKKLKYKNLKETDPNGMETGRIIGQIMEVEFYDKYEATKLLGREKETFKETKKVEHDMAAGMKSLLLGSLQRAEQASIPAPSYRDVTDE